MDGKVENNFYFLIAEPEPSAEQMTGTQPISDCALQWAEIFSVDFLSSLSCCSESLKLVHHCNLRKSE